MSKCEEFISQCREFIKNTVEVACPEVKITVEACEKDDGFDVVANGKIDEYATFEEEYHIRTFEDFTAKLPMFIISVFQVYYYSTKCGMFCANAEICKYRPEV